MMESILQIAIAVLVIVILSFFAGMGMGKVLQKESEYLRRLNDEE